MDPIDIQTAPAGTRPEQTAQPLTFRQRMLAFFNGIVILIDRHIHRWQCPYCFSYITRPGSRERGGDGSRVSVDGASVPLPGARTYICRNCNNALPPDFFANHSTSIAVVGGTEAGKSSFITMFCELLLHRRSTLGELGIFGSIINPEGLEKFEAHRQMLIQQERALHGTLEMEAPIVVCLHSKHHRMVTYITLLDSPGEHFSKLKELHTHHPNLRNASGIVFLMNPLDIPELLRLIRKEKPGIFPPGQDVNVRNYDIIETLYRFYVETGTVKPNRRIGTPAAFCLSRADVLEDIANLYLPPDFEPDVPDPDIILEEMALVTEDLLELIEETDPNLLNIMKKRFRTMSLFPVSPLGKMPVGDAIGQRIEGGVNPKGLLQPIIWILKEIKFIRQS